MANKKPKNANQSVETMKQQDCPANLFKLRKNTLEPFSHSLENIGLFRVFLYGLFGLFRRGSRID